MRLRLILENIPGIKKTDGSESIEITGLACDSRSVKDGNLFIAVKGSIFDGADFIEDAIDRGAKAVITEDRTLRVSRRGITFIYVEDARLAMAFACKSFYKDLSNKMKIVGVTGTNGKTTTTYLIESILAGNGDRAGVIGTVNYRFGDRSIPASNTTPGILELYSLLNCMYKDGIKNCVMEVSSHSLEQGRVDTIGFDVAVFTNLTSEHLDFHKDMENYLRAKMKLFTKLKKGGAAVINRDDPFAEKIINFIRGLDNINIITYGIDSYADIFASNIKSSFKGVNFRLSIQDEIVDREIAALLIGRYNVYNILASIGACMAMGMEIEDIISAIPAINALPPGRLDRIDEGQDFYVFVDYAHTENSLENVLKALRQLATARLIVVFGCGGDRDKTKRPKMGKVSSELCDKVFITSDNPRSEDPLDIIDDIIKGISVEKNNYVVEPDRFKAIELAIKEARKDDIVLIAGKGHEAYQIFKDITIPFDDRVVARKILDEQIKSWSKRSRA